MSDNKRLVATVHGRVQGVSFRYYTQGEARRLGIVGWVANQRDGSVKVVAEGEPETLHLFEQFLQRGSPQAQVSLVDVVWQDPTGEFSHFSVRWF